MSVARFLHAADLHLGSPLQSLGDAIGDKERERIRALVNGAFDRLVNVAIDEQVDFVVLAGDIYDTAERDPGAQRRFFLGLERLSTEGIRVFLAHGNHDPLTTSVKVGRLPDGVTVFPPGRVLAEKVTMRNGAEVVVAGVSYETQHELENLVPLFAGLEGRTIVGVLHTNVGGNSQHGNYAPSTESDLVRSPVHYWALGHIHTRQVHQTPNGWWAYPGNLQGRSSKAAECGAKGVLIVEVDEAGDLATPRFVECCTVRFARVEVSVSGITDVPQVNEAVLTELRKLQGEAGGVPLLVRLELTGETEISELLEPGKWDTAQTIEEANDELADGAVIKLEISCVPQLDLQRERERGTLLAAVLTALDNLEEKDLSIETKKSAAAILAKALRGET